MLENNSEKKRVNVLLWCIWRCREPAMWGRVGVAGYVGEG